MEDESEVVDSKSSNEDVEELRDIAITQEMDDEKDN
jgi:hypothetical protein